MRIVIVEDEIAIREGLKKMISNSTSHTVIGTCKNGVEGIDFIKKNHPDLVITDIRMNEASGLEMLTQLKNQGEEFYSIIISGYSEFEYAREAIRLGTEEYLLKPVSIDALQSTLNGIEKKLIESKFQIVKRPENYVREYFFDTQKEQSEAKLILHRILPEEKEKVYGIFAGYFGNVEKDQLDEVEFPIRSIKHQFLNLKYLDAWEETIRFRILILHGSESQLQEFSVAFDEMVRHDYQMLKREIPWGMDYCDTIDEWKGCFEHVKKVLSECIVKGCRELLRPKEIVKESKKEFIYPVQEERKILSCLEAGDFRKLRHEIDEFLAQVILEEYAAEQIRHGVLKLATKMMDMAKEINQKAYETFQREDEIKKLLLAYTKTEIRATLLKFGELICDRKKKEGISNYTINRTLEYIRTHYKEGITLEKTAEVMNITPEYLSMLFKREMGMNFSVFLKEFRISHAKRLLKGTDLKIYEVAQECGYSNSNYFTKVFKEITGISPAEYR